MINTNIIEKIYSQIELCGYIHLVNVPISEIVRGNKALLEKVVNRIEFFGLNPNFTTKKHKFPK